jgi:hypothetical protein
MGMLARQGFRTKRDRVVLNKNVYVEADVTPAIAKSLVAHDVTINGGLEVTVGTIQQVITPFKDFALTVQDIELDVPKIFYLVFPATCFIVAARYSITGEGAGHTTGCILTFSDPFVGIPAWGHIDIPAPADTVQLTGSYVFGTSYHAGDIWFRQVMVSQVRTVICNGLGAGDGHVDLTLECQTTL